MLSLRKKNGISSCPTCLRSYFPVRVPDVLTDLLGPLHDFQSAAAVNHIIARLFMMQAANRIPERTAANLLYTCQLLLQSLPETKRELSTARKSPKQEPEITKVVKSLPPLGAGPDARMPRK